MNFKALIAANPTSEGYGDGWYVDTMNVLLDRWAYSHVQFLRKKFLEATGDKGETELDKRGFFKLFAELQDMPTAVAESAFRMFDTDNSGKLNFREFCCALALCCHLMSSDDEKIRFVFDMFDTNDDGLLGSGEVQQLLEHALQKEEPKEEDKKAEESREDRDAAMAARRQQRILEIKNELLASSQHLNFERFYEWASRNLDSLNNLLHTFQIVPSPDRERTICEEILSRHQALQEGSTWYCISHKWLQVWKAHACWKGPSPGRRLISNQGLLIPVTSRDRTISGEFGLQDEDAEDEIIAVMSEAMLGVGSHHMSSRPPEIDNSDLEGEHKGELKMNLVEHLDYELIPEEMWLKLVEWYGGGPAILRKVICMGQDQQPQVELYPPFVLVVVAGENGQPLPQFSRRFFISRQSSLDEVLQMLAEKLSRPADRSRLWHRTQGEQWLLVQRMDITLEEFLEGKIWDAGAFLLETQRTAGDWPRDTMLTSNSGEVPAVSEALSDRELQRHFEVGDRVEAQSGGTNTWMRGTIVDVIQRDHSSAPSQVKVHYDSTVYKCDEWISTSSDRLAPLDTHTAATGSSTLSTSVQGLPLVRGATGLQNLGNTCFLNATVQCMANTPLLREYFLSARYLRDVNERNSGCKGRLAEEFGHVIGDLWGGKTATLTPRNLKRTIDQFAPQFAGYEQHDAQELLAFVLDGLHEDLNHGTLCNSSGVRGGSGSRSEVGTPKLFSRTKPVRGAAGVALGGSREMSPTTKRAAKAAWRDKGADASTPSALPAPEVVTTKVQTICSLDAPAALCSTASTTIEETSTRDTSPSQAASNATFGMAVVAPPLPGAAIGPGVGEPAEEGPETTTSIAVVDDSVQPASRGGQTASGGDLNIPDDEASREAERVVHPTLLWMRTRPGGNGGDGACASKGNTQRTGASGDEVPASREAALPSTPKVSHLGLGRHAPPAREAGSAPPVQQNSSSASTAAAPADDQGPSMLDSAVERLLRETSRGMNTCEDPSCSSATDPLLELCDGEQIRRSGNSRLQMMWNNGSGQEQATPASPHEVGTPPPSLNNTGSTRASESARKQQGTSRWWSFAWRRGRGALDLPKELNPDSPLEAAYVPASSSVTPSAPAASGVVCCETPVEAFSKQDLASSTTDFAERQHMAPEEDSCASSREMGKETATEEELTSRPPLGDDQNCRRWADQAGIGSAAVTGISTARVSSDVSEDGTSGMESEDFIPELLTPHRPGYRRSLSLFKLPSWGRRKLEDDGAAPGSSSPKRRPRTPPAMTPLKEEPHGAASSNPQEPIAEEPPGECDHPDLAQQMSNASDSVNTAITPEVGTGSGVGPRSLFPWKGKRPGQDRSRADLHRSREGSRDSGEELERGTSREGRGGRTKDKESSWPSFLRRAKSRERVRPSGPSGARPPLAPHRGDIPIMDSSDDGTKDGPAICGEGDVTHPARANSDEGARPPRELSEPRRHSDNEEDRPVQRTSALGFPFLRAPWKRDANAGMRGPSPAKGLRPAEDAARTPVTDRAVSSSTLAPEPIESPDNTGVETAPASVSEAISSHDGLSAGGAPAGASTRDTTRDAPHEVDAIGNAVSTTTAATNPDDKEGDGVLSEENGEEETEVDEDNLPDDEKAALQWERYRARNRSLIVDIFEGQLRSQLTCCRCGASSSTFEPFRYLSVPIPSNHVDRASVRIIFFPLPYSQGEERQQLVRYSVTVPKSSIVNKVEKALSTLLPVPMSSVLLAEVYRSRIHRYLDSLLPLSDMRAEDQLFAFEVLQAPAELVEFQERYAPSKQRKERTEDSKKQPQPRVLLIQAMHRRVVDVCRSDGRTWAQRREVFGLPFVMSAASSWTYATLHDMLVLHARRFLRPPRKEVSEERQAQMPFVARIVNASGTACGACDRRNCTGCLLPKDNKRLRLRTGLLAGAVTTAKIYLALDWIDSALYDQEYIDAVVDDASVARANAAEWQERDDTDADRSEGSGAPAQARERGQGAGVVPISACIEAFAEPEELKAEFGNGVKCEKCGEVTDAVKKLEMWREPDLLLLHIKRFYFSGDHYEKLNTPIDVPFKELNLRPWIVGPSAASAVPYDLYAVACHWGGMSGGHYTSYCMNGEGKEPVWLKFNDESVTGVSLSQEFEDISRQCYVLFYRKRAFSSSNLINYSSLL